jgi:hypothetical protein
MSGGVDARPIGDHAGVGPGCGRLIQVVEDPVDTDLNASPTL